MTNSIESSGRISLSALAAVLFGFCASGIQAQPTAECRLRGADTTLVTGVTIKKCLDLDALNGKSIEIPSNVTRIDNTGFSLCESSEQSGGQADIVYVMDQSGSMGISYVWISPGPQGYGLPGIGRRLRPTSTPMLTGFGTITLPNDAGVRQVPRLNPAKPPTGCTSFAGRSLHPARRRLQAGHRLPGRARAQVHGRITWASPRT